MRTLSRLVPLVLLLVTSWSVLAQEAEVLVTCGSVIKLEHDGTKHLLHSQEVSYGYGRSSGQQSVTGYPERNSASSMWIVRGAEGACVQGTTVTDGMLVKLQHIATRRWLHSHLFHSPLSNNQEVSAFGSEEQSDTGDVWVVEVEGGKQWKRDAIVRLLHKDTSAYLASHNVKYNRPIPGHTEVYATKSKGKPVQWRATEGIYFTQHKEGE